MVGTATSTGVMPLRSAVPTRTTVAAMDAGAPAVVASASVVGVETTRIGVPAARPVAGIRDGGTARTTRTCPTSGGPAGASWSGDSRAPATRSDRATCPTTSPRRPASIAASPGAAETSTTARSASVTTAPTGTAAGHDQHRHPVGRRGDHPQGGQRAEDREDHPGGDHRGPATPGQAHDRHRRRAGTGRGRSGSTCAALRRDGHRSSSVSPFFLESVRSQHGCGPGVVGQVSNTCSSPMLTVVVEARTTVSTPDSPPLVHATCQVVVAVTG